MLSPFSKEFKNHTGVIICLSTTVIRGNKNNVNVYERENGKKLQVIAVKSFEFFSNGDRECNEP